MAKLRHIAIVVQDPEQSAKFFETAFDMKVVGKARRGLYVSDGVMNVALLKVELEDERLGVTHLGMWVDDLDASEKKVVDAGGTYLSGRPTLPIPSTRRNTAIPTAWSSISPTMDRPAPSRTSSRRRERRRPWNPSP